MERDRAIGRQLPSAGTAADRWNGNARRRWQSHIQPNGSDSSAGPAASGIPQPIRYDGGRSSAGGSTGVSTGDSSANSVVNSAVNLAANSNGGATGRDAASSPPPSIQISGANSSANSTPTPPVTPSPAADPPVIASPAPPVHPVQVGAAPTQSEVGAVFFPRPRRCRPPRLGGSSSLLRADRAGPRICGPPM